MGALVRDLLDLGTVAQAPIDRVDLDLRALVEEATRALAPIAEKRGVALHVEAGNAVSVEGDAAAIVRIVRILVDHAIAHTHSGTRVTVTVRDARDFVELRVSDDGPGIPLDEQERVFERFARVDKARARAQGGSGLGLAIARTLAGRHGGSIRLDSIPGEGATFTVRLPRHA